jgi:hypothetical protein
VVAGEDVWQSARLIPTSGINGAEEQERRATSALLAVMTSVNEFGRRLLSSIGGPGVSAAGTKRGLGRGSFIESVVGSVDSFYEDIGQRIKPYVPPSPKYGELGAAEATPRDVASSKAETSSGSEIPAPGVASPAE